MSGVVEENAELFRVPSLFINKDIRLQGRLLKLRSLGKNLTFIVLRTIHGKIQCVMTEQTDLVVGSILMVHGKFRENPSVNTGIVGFEVEISNIDVFSTPIDLHMFDEENLPSRAFRIQNRHIDLRRERINAIFRIKSELIKGTHEFFSEKEWLYVNTPRIVGSIAEGPVEKIVVDYFGESAYLSVASVLHHGILISGDLDKVYEINHLFSGEKMNTSRNVNEFLALELAASYYSRYEIMDLVENYIISMIKRILAECENELCVLNSDLYNIPKDFAIITYDEVISLIQQEGVNFEWAESHELPSEGTEILKAHFDGFFWLINQPVKQKWFFVKSKEVDEKEVCLDFQLWHSDGLRLAEGSERTTNYFEAKRRIIAHGLNPLNFTNYLNALKHGIPPFSGLGIGLERLLMVLLGLSNIRETILFPRDKDTLNP